MFDYRREDFDFAAARPVIAAALKETQRGRGLALVRGLAREGLDEKEFVLLTWAIGRHADVARPRGTTGQHIAPVRDEGTTSSSAGVELFLER